MTYTHVHVIRDMYVPDVINISKTFPINSIQNKLIPQAEPPCSIERLLKSD